MKNHSFCLLIVLLFIQNLIFAQEGYIYLTNYEINEAYADSKIRSIAFDNNSSVLLANRKGVAVFTGTSWRRVQNIPANVLSIKADSSARLIYTGLKDEFGYISRNEKGLYQYTQLKQFDENTGEFTQIIITTEKILFYSSKSIYIVDKTKLSDISQLNIEKQDEYRGILTRKNNVYINTKSKGICKLNGQELIQLKEGAKFKNSIVLFSTSCNKVSILIGTNENKLYLFDGKSFKRFSERTQIRDFLKENILWDGIDFSDNYFALTTLTGGCVIIDKVYGKIKFNINYMTGLPDDEIYAFSKDKNNALWFSHEHGLSSCDLKLNIRDYTPYPGIYGNINDVLLKGDDIYVASNNGVYVLNEIKNVKEKEILIKEKAKYGYQFIPKKTYIIQSIAHKFLPVKGLSDKCKQLYEFNEKVLAISDFGLYEITDSVAHPLIKDIYIHSLWADKDTSVLYAASLKGVQLLSFSVDSATNERKWEKQLLFENAGKPVHSICQDTLGNLVFGTDGKAYFCKKDSLLSYSKPLEIEFPGKINEAINVNPINDELYFIQSSGIFVYNSKNKSAEYKDKKKFQQKNFRFINSNSNFWVYENNIWLSVDPNINLPNSRFWNLFGKIRKIHVDHNSDTWLINGKKELIKILADTTNQGKHNFQVYISSIYDKTDSLYSLENPVFEYERNAFKIRLSAPFRLNPKGTQYRFLVKGLQNYESWSNWSENQLIELSFIPAGKYILSVNARNILGQTSDIQKFAFIVLKPFWQTNTFYYSAGGGLLVFIILLIYLSRLRLKRKNRILEMKVQERTIELQKEKDKTEELLLNILPKETADELKQNNKVVPRNYDLVTVLFTDFKGFTQIAEKLSPAELVHEIDHCFKKFDKIISKYRIEKIKTIGDAYMCAGGLPKEYKHNAAEVIKAAIEIRDFMLRYKDKRVQEKKACFEIRIGLHTGKVVAGVVGIKKYAYDIWGDTVNIASRMESSGEPGKINISGDTYQLVKDTFNCSYRGKIEAKNKGEIDMYFVDDEK